MSGRSSAEGPRREWFSRLHRNPKRSNPAFLVVTLRKAVTGEHRLRRDSRQQRQRGQLTRPRANTGILRAQKRAAQNDGSARQTRN
jgi:hypothetical protein